MLPHVKILRLLQYVSILFADVIAWKCHEPAKITFKLDEYRSETFIGNESMNVFLRLLYLEKDTALFGGRNVVYNVSLEDLHEITERRIIWNPSVAHTELCKLKGKSENDCHNYIRVAAKINDDVLYVCGTNAYKPLCQKYNTSQNEPIVIKHNIEGNGKCPFDPTHNSTAIFSGGHLYSATVTDFSGSDPVIYREPLRTERSDSKQLNEPNFVGSVSYQDYMLFFFREPAVEHINCGKIIFSRVGRVCKNDKGGPHMYQDRWTSFLKSRLNCSIPGEYPFYFNEIQAISDIIDGEYIGVSEQLIYGVFNTPVNSIGGSAICAFSLRSIIATFNGPFKEQENMNSNWLPVAKSKLPDPRPGNCVNDSRTLPDSSVTFAKTHSLMDDAVPAFHNHPVFIRISWQYRFSAIAVDPKVKTINGEKFDVLFIGTDDGKVLKVSCVVGNNITEVKANLIEELQVIENSPIRKLSIVRPMNSETKLLVVSDSKVRMIPLQRCELLNNCIDCIESQDPYCSWNIYIKKCISLQDIDLRNNRYLILNVTNGQHKICSNSDSASTNVQSNVVHDNDNSIDLSKCPTCENCNAIEPCNGEDTHRDKIAVIYITDTMGLLIGSCVLVTLIVGFAAGYLCSRHFRADPYSNVSLHTNHQLNRLTEAPLNSEGGSTFLPPCSNNKAAAINLVINATKNSNDKNCTIDNKTLQKVKKTYI
ncbi:hypothetical protein PGB90_005443 [Kerria lacca]